MSHSFVFRNLVAFPRPFCARRRGARFDSTIERTYALLDCELRAVKAQNSVVQLRLGADGLTAKKLPKIALPPEVVLSFERDGHSITMPCDTFTDWRDNLRGIALSLESLRAVDRYGVTQSGEQYRGWEALPPAEPSDTEPDFANSSDALGWLRAWSDLEDPRAAYRHLARIFHPDAGGDAAKFRLLQRAKEMLNI